MLNPSAGLARRILGGSSQISLASASARVISLVGFPLLSRWLGPAPYGVLSLVGTLVGLASNVGLLGLDMSYARFSLDGDRDQKEIEAFCWTRAFFASLLLALVSSVVWQFIRIDWGIRDAAVVALFLPPSIIVAVLATMSTTRARLSSSYRRISVAMVSSAMIALVASLFVSWLGVRGVAPLLLGAFLSSGLILVFLGTPSPTELVRGIGSLPVSRRNQVYKLGFSCAVTGPLYWLISTSDRWFIARWAGESELGIYSIASTIALSGIMINSAVHQVLFPEASRVYGRGEGELNGLARLWEALTGLLLVVMIVIGCLGGDILKILTAKSFHSGSEYVPWLAASAFFYGFAGLGNLFYFLEGRMSRVVIFWIVSAIVCFVSNFLLVPVLGASGAAIAQFLAYGALAFQTVLFGSLLSPMSLRWPRVLGAIAIAIAFLVFCNSWFYPSILVDFITKICLSGLVALVLMMLLSRSFLISALRRGFNVVKQAA